MECELSGKQSTQRKTMMDVKNELLIIMLLFFFNLLKQ